MSRLEPLPPGAVPEVAEIFEKFRSTGHYIPNSQLILQRKPKILLALRGLSTAVMDPAGEVPVGLKRLIGYVASRVHGCQYCMAHNAGGALQHGIDGDKLAAVWEYQTSPLFTEAERAALDLAIAAGAQPNDVTDEMFERMKLSWSESQIVEIVAVVSYFGFMNRFNDTMATPLEDEPIRTAQEHIAQHGWDLGKHGR